MMARASGSLDSLNSITIPSVDSRKMRKGQPWQDV